MEVENQELSGLVAAVVAAVEAAASEDVVQPLFAETVATPEEVLAEEVDSNSIPDVEDSPETSSEASSEPTPPEVAKWVEEIDNIQYYYTHDDDERGYNFFRDTAGNTLFIQEFDVKGVRYFNINREHIIKQEDFLNILSAHKEEAGVNVTTFGQQLLRGCSTDLLVEALTILADNGSDSSSDASSDADASSDTESGSDTDSTSDAESTPEEPEPSSSPIPGKGDAVAVQNFLLSFFLVLMIIRAIGLIGQLV